MCGITGLALTAGATPSATVLEALTRALAHRGPDGAGHHVSGNVALAHTRLAIIDLATGDQPLFAGSAALVANGEVYNYRELRHDNALTCATASDCEPPLHLYRRDGAAFAQNLRGMYGIAIHDRAARQVVLLRADWTRRDPTITAALGALGRSGVPVYQLQMPGKAPVLLPEVLSPAEIRQALSRP